MLLPILFTVAFIALSVPLVVAPLRKRTPTGAGTPVRDQTNKDSDYEATLLALRDLEFDRELGVVSDEDYTRLRPQLVSQAASALQTSQKREEEISAQIEAAVRAQRHQSQQRRSATPRFCPQCGRPRDVGDRFCAGCGTSFQ